MPSTDIAPAESAVASVAKPASVAQCHEVIEAQARQIELLMQRVTHQEEQMALLQERLKLDSRNSSKPPSSDGPGKPNRAQRRATRVRHQTAVFSDFWSLVSMESMV